jgi:hypothetical protein
MFSSDGLTVDPWWYLDLGSTAIQVSSVYVWQRTDCEHASCSSRMINLEVRIGSNLVGHTWNNSLCNYEEKTWTKVYGINLPCPQPLVGPIVTIQGEFVKAD